MNIGGSFEALLALCEQRVAINRENDLRWAVSFAPYGDPERWLQENHVRLGEALRRAVSVSQTIVFNGYIDSSHKGSERSRPAKVHRSSEAGESSSLGGPRGERDSL
jgi:hypothetical protein